MPEKIAKRVTVTNFARLSSTWRTTTLHKWLIGGRAPRIPASDLLYPGSPQFNTILKNFEGNVEKVINVAKRRAIPVVFLEGVSRRRGFGLGMPMHDPSLKGAVLEEWNKNFTGAETLFAQKRYSDAIKLYNKCIESDPFYAMEYYGIAECHEGLKNFRMANKFYTIANDRDCFPTRGPSGVNRFYEGLRARNMQGVYIVETQGVFEKQSPEGIIDAALISDQVHPTIKGQALMALEIVKIIYENDLHLPRAGSPGHTGRQEIKKEI